MIAYLCFWCPHKLVFLQDLNESHLSLHEGKPHPNTVPRAPAKRHVAYSRALCLLLRSEPEEGREGEPWRKGGKRTLPFWVKFLWFWPVFLNVLEELDGDMDSCSLGNGDSVDLNGLHSKT